MRVILGVSLRVLHTMATTHRPVQGAAVAADVVSGRLDNPLLVVPMTKVPAVGQPGVPRPHAAPHFGHASFPRIGMGGASVRPLFPTAGANVTQLSCLPGLLSGMLSACRALFAGDRTGNGAAPLFPGIGVAKPAGTGKSVFGAVPQSFFPAAAAASNQNGTSPTFGGMHT